MSRLADYMRAGRFVITSKLTPPKGIDLQELLGRAEAMRAHVDAFNITESPRARMWRRAGSVRVGISAANVPGIRVPEVLLKEMDSAGAQQRETTAGIEIAARLVSALRPMVAGVHIKALGWEAHIAQMLARSNL